MTSLSADIILGATSVGVLCTDREGRIRYVNSAAATLLGPHD